MISYDVIVLAAGKGSRTGLSYNKMFYVLEDGRTVLETSLDRFRKDPDCEQIIVVCAPEERDLVMKYADGCLVCTGGATRQESVYEGLRLVKSGHVLIHDGARPFLGKRELEALKEALVCEQAALLMVPSTDTLKQVKDGYVVATPARSSLWAAQTPQGFQTNLIRVCHEKARSAHFTGTDDCSLVEEFSQVPVRVVPGDPSNKKITLPGDVEK